jgi:hypothetical protein
MKRCLLFFTLFLGFQLSAQDVQRATLSYTPSENGYELKIPFSWKFINCYGETHVTITKNSKDITSNAYVYNGRRYTSAELGAEAFVKPSCGVTDLRADVYHNSFKLGNILMGNVIDWLGGCFGQTYYVSKMLGLNDADYKDKVAELSLSNLKIENISSRNYSLEGKIKEIEKQNKLTDKVNEADISYANGNYEEAQALYKEALKIDGNNAHAKQRLSEIKDKLIASKNEEAYNSSIAKAEEFIANGEYEKAKAEYEKALRSKPGDRYAQEKIDELNEKLQNEVKSQRNKAVAVGNATNRNHKGFFWGKNFGADSPGSATQEANLIGNFRLDYDIWSLAGEPAHRFRFYWEWDNALNTGYPQWVSVLHDEVVMINEFKKYPDLMNRWEQIRPLYIEVECEILYYKNGEDFVADEGRMTVVPEHIGYSAQELDWSLPSSSNWDELFTYCNGIDWDYFRGLGLYEEMEEYEEKFGTSITWAKYAFEYSDQIHFYINRTLFSSEFIEINNNDYEYYSTSADIVKVVWPEEEIQSLINEFEEREKEKEEETMTEEDFWNSPESTKKTNAESSFWDSPENTTTKTDLRNQQYISQYNNLISSWPEIIKNQRDKYEALKNPFSISYPLENAVVEEGRINVKGQLHPYLKKKNAQVEIEIKDERFSSSISGSGFSSNIILEEGWNTLLMNITMNGFGFTDSSKIYYKKPPPLPCNEQTNSGGEGRTINEHGLGTTDGIFYVDYDMYSAPDELIIYSGPKERISQSNIIYETYGKVSGDRRKQIAFSNIESGIITVEVNGSDGTSWEYVIECPE